MAKHAKRTLRGRIVGAALVAVALTVATALVGAQTASASLLIPDKKEVQPTNFDVAARCAFGVKSVNPLNLDTKIKLSGQAQPNNSSGYANNVFTQVNCYLLPAGDTNPADALAEIHPSAPGATVLASGTTVTVAYANSYTLCGYAFVKLVNGNSSFTPYVCA